MLTAALIDLDTPGKIIKQRSFKAHKQPMFFKFYLAREKVDPAVNYGVAAVISVGPEIVYQTKKRYPVIHNGKMTTHVVLQPML